MSETTVDEILDVLTDAAPEIRGSLAGRRGKRAGENPSGETQIAADVMADELLVERLSAIDGVGAVATEEREAPVDCGAGLSVTVDPLDGSSNLASNNPMGTILGVYDASLPARGRDLVAAASVVFGPITTMAVARDGTAVEYELVDGERQVADDPLELPSDPVVYGFGGGDPSWTEPFAAFAEEIRDELKLRYGGALVADVNQVLEYGGIFAYPALEERPEGKLRHQFEGNPIAYLLEAAGGASSDSDGSILDREPEDLHDRCPIYVGNEALIERLEAALSE